MMLLLLLLLLFLCIYSPSCAKNIHNHFLKISCIGGYRDLRSYLSEVYWTEQGANAMGPLLPCLLLKGRQYERDGGWVKELYVVDEFLGG
jgi:hypothetical protein